MPRAATPKEAPPGPKPAGAASSRSGPQRAMDKLGLRRDIDLALHLPLRYEDETCIHRIADAREGQAVQFEGVVRDARVEFRPRRQLLVTLDDGSGQVLLRFFSFYASQQKTLAEGARIRVRGELRGGFLGREIVHPTFRRVEPGEPLPTALTPVYPTSAQLPQAYLRKAVSGALARVDLCELLPAQWLPPGLPALAQALDQLHHPRTGLSLAALEDRSAPPWQRLKFDELLAQQLSAWQARLERERLRAPTLTPPPPDGQVPLPEALLAALPFQLTGAQQRVVQEIAVDLQRPQPMNRLLQGDVGSGKTVVAALAACATIESGWQCALMAPTEILAEQHFRKLVQWLEPLLQPRGRTVAWLTGGQRKAARRQALKEVASGQAALVIGTHAVIQEQVRFHRLGLAIIDEQHRFGVAQRLALREKLRACGSDGLPLEPHLLMMSATPIPRTLAMTYYADLAVSTIDELPPGRTPVVTKVFSDDKRAAVIERIREAVAQGRQAYWVCPLVEESEHLDLRHVTETHEQLGAAMPDVGVGLLHGRMSPTEKSAVMARFEQGELAVLVATTVIEVGVDVPNASLMVIEHAERFGLSQLHQLRGRVGRGAVASVCVLLYTAPLSQTGKARLRAMSETTDGFEIARRDLDIRGPGEFMGARQSGTPLLRFADLNEDAGLLAQARRIAPLWLDADPDSAQAHVARWLGAGVDYLKA